MVAPPDITALRRRLWQAGFRPIEIYSHDAGVSDAGKRPIGNAWQERARRDPPAAVVEPVSTLGLNTGILSDALRALDIDIDDTAVARQVQDVALRLLGGAPIRWRSNSARCLLLYRADEGAPQKAVCKGRFGKVEVLGRGQQICRVWRAPDRGSVASHRSGDARVVAADCGGGVAGGQFPLRRCTRDRRQISNASAAGQTTDG
jgi:Bifunctional DNA primase/polymerase, N-terminal